MNQQLTENDRKEVKKFRQYLKACADWDIANGEVLVVTRMKAHADIYENIYGQQP